MKAYGCHVFAGGFTRGVRKVFDVLGQLEIHDFGRPTVEAMGVPFLNQPKWEHWPATNGQVDFLYGNPRCTGFSTVTAGYDETAHGPWSNQTADVHDLCKYGVRERIPVIIWESVQQAFTTGRPLLDHLRDAYFVPAGYRIAHVFVNAASFGNCQLRKRYFFVAHTADLTFNFTPPTLPERQATLWDVIGDHVADVHPVKYNDTDEYDRDSCYDVNADEWKVLPHLGPRECLNRFAREHEDHLAKLVPRYHEKWLTRCSERPFSLHCIYRCAADRHCPTLKSSSQRLVHPTVHRTLTVGELSKVMGWGDAIPSGKAPAAQIAKGVVPAVGEWLAQQAMDCLTGRWANDDWASSYDPVRGEWIGQDLRGKPAEKVMDLTKYAPAKGQDDDDDVQ